MGLAVVKLLHRLGQWHGCCMGFILPECFSAGFHEKTWFRMMEIARPAKFLQTDVAPCGASS
jgi:hypothetical protein